MKGLELARLYYTQIGQVMIENTFAAYKSKIAAGLVGEGSECFGFDDELSRDHDWGPGFCLWLTKEDYAVIGQDLQQEYNKMSKSFLGYQRLDTPLSGARVGVFEIGSFYKRFLGLNHVPHTLLEWRRIPETYLAAATNGEVFFDELQQFTSFREQLKAFYPEDIRLKKIAARCMSMAQSGQYNYGRCMKRREYVAAQCALTEFINSTMSMIFLLNKKYTPFYKWTHKSLQNLPLLGSAAYRLLLDLTECKQGDASYNEKVEVIEQLCEMVVHTLRGQGLSNTASDFLLDHGSKVQSLIKDSQIRAIPVMSE